MRGDEATPASYSQQGCTQVDFGNHLQKYFLLQLFFKSMKSFVDRDVQRGEGKLHVKVRTSLGTSACYPIMNACKEKMIFVFLKTGCFNFCVWLLCKNIQFDKSSVIWFN